MLSQVVTDQKLNKPSMLIENSEGMRCPLDTAKPFTAALPCLWFRRASELQTVEEVALLVAEWATEWEKLRTKYVATITYSVHRRRYESHVAALVNQLFRPTLPSSREEWLQVHYLVEAALEVVVLAAWGHKSLTKFSTTVATSLTKDNFFDMTTAITAAETAAEKKTTGGIDLVDLTGDTTNTTTAVRQTSDAGIAGIQASLSGLIQKTANLENSIFSSIRGSGGRGGGSRGRGGNRL